jgi:hypothetical protein
MTLPIGRFLALLLSTAVGIGSAKVLLTAEYKGHRYHLLDQKEWAEQNREAQSNGWYLVAITDEEENNFIRTTFAGPRGNVWIGLTDESSEGRFYWTNGEPLTYTFWAPNEPNNDQSEGNWVHMYETGHWNDELKSRQFFAVAEEDPALVKPVSVSKWLFWGLLAPALALGFVLLRRRRLARSRNGSFGRR